MVVRCCCTPFIPSMGEGGRGRGEGRGEGEREGGGGHGRRGGKRERVG